MSTKRWFARRELISKSEAITFDVASPAQLARRINGGPLEQLAVFNDIPVSGVATVNVTLGGNLSTVAGSYLTYTGFQPNPYGISALPASNVITLSKPGVYTFYPILDIQCGVAPEIPCEVWMQLEIDGVSINNRTLYSIGETGAPTRSLGFSFIHGQGVGNASVRFEVQGDSSPNGTPITLTNARVFIGVSEIHL